MSAGLPAVASASATDPGTPAVTTTATSAVPETAAPTADADLVMWNAAPAASESDTTAATSATASTPVGRRLARILNVQRFANGIAARGAAMASNLTKNALRFLGVPYAFGGTSAYGFDCSGFVQHVYAMMGKHLPRTADGQFAVAQRIDGDPKAGDLVFFHTYESGVSHVGISLGGDRFVHSSSSHGVMVSSLHDSYWGPRYLGAKRIVQ